jgi:hypothetical protein
VLGATTLRPYSSTTGIPSPNLLIVRIWRGLGTPVPRGEDFSGIRPEHYRIYKHILFHK